MANLDEMAKKVRKLQLRAAIAKTNLRDLAEGLPVKWIEIEEVAEKTHAVYAELDGARRACQNEDFAMRSKFISRDGSIWVPEYLIAIDGKICIGCGRCFKVCSREVMHLYGVDDAGEILGACDADDDDFDGELNRMIMVVDHAGRCIGCGACGRVCPKNCQTHLAADQIAA